MEINKILDDMVLSHRELVKSNEAIVANNEKLVANNQSLICVNSEAVMLARLNHKLVAICEEISEGLAEKESLNIMERGWQMAIKEALHDK